MIEPPRALRLTFLYKEGRLRLLSRIPVEATVPASDDPPLLAGEHGSWLELLDASNRRLYRLLLHDPIPTDTEVFSPDPRQTMTRLPVAPKQAVFSVLVPELPEAETVALFSSAFRPTAGTAIATADGVPLEPIANLPLAPARPVARFPIKG